MKAQATARVAGSVGRRTARAPHRTQPHRIGISHASNSSLPVQYVADRSTQTQTAPAGSEDEASFFIRNLRALPWQRVAVWLVVGSVALQLSDFFGVRVQLLWAAVCVLYGSGAANQPSRPFGCPGLQQAADFEAHMHTKAFWSLYNSGTCLWPVSGLNVAPLAIKSTATLHFLQLHALRLQIFMGTFILTFVGRSLTVWAQQSNHLKSVISSASARRKVLVLAYFITIALILSVFGVLTIPYIVREGADFIGRLQAENIWCALLRAATGSPRPGCLTGRTVLN